MKLTSMHVDGLLYVLIQASGTTGFVSLFYGERALKFISPNTQFWLEVAAAAIFGVSSSIKVFRSTAFAKHTSTLTSSPPSRQSSAAPSPSDRPEPLAPLPEALPARSPADSPQTTSASP